MTNVLSIYLSFIIRKIIYITLLYRENDINQRNNLKLKYFNEYVPGFQINSRYRSEIERRKIQMSSWFVKGIRGKVQKSVLLLLAVLLFAQCTFIHNESRYVQAFMPDQSNHSQRSNTDILLDQSEPVESENLSNIPGSQTKLFRTLFRNQLQADPFGLFFVSSGQYKVLQYETFAIITCCTIMISMKFIGVRLQKDGKK